MQLRILRRWLAVCLVAALTIGQAAQAFAVPAMDTNRLTAVTSGEMVPMPAGCDGCSGEDAMPAAGCFALCGGAVAILPSVATSKVISAKQLPITVVRIGSGRDSSPDPYPPRRTTLS